MGLTLIMVVIMIMIMLSKAPLLQYQSKKELTELLDREKGHTSSIDPLCHGELAPLCISCKKNLALKEILARRR